LDICDKHSQIVPIFKATRVKFDRAIKGANRIRMRGIQVALGPDEKLNMVSGMTGRIELESDIHATFDAFFQDGQPMGREPVIPKLQQLSQLASGVIETVEDACA